jgi:hypothetical protein
MGDEDLLLDTEELGDWCDYSDDSQLLDAIDARRMDEVRQAARLGRRD